jgi:hypothetical protein
VDCWNVDYQPSRFTSLAQVIPYPPSTQRS